MLPDHPEANKQGCRCPVHTGNNHGEGTVIDGIRSWMINPECPIHSDWKWWTRKPSLPQPI